MTSLYTGGASEHSGVGEGGCEGGGEAEATQTEHGLHPGVQEEGLVVTCYVLLSRVVCYVSLVVSVTFDVLCDV